MAGALREIIAHFGFDFDGKKADEADKKIGHVKHSAEHSAHGVETLIHAANALLGVSIAREVREWVESIAQSAVEIENTAQATGLSTKALQVWQFGAKQANLDAGEFAMSLRRLSTALAGGVDETGSQSKVFAKLKISTKDAHGQVRQLGDVLPEIADRFHDMKDGAAKAALAQELFGRQGARMIPLLNKGSAGVAELTRDFEELGGGFQPEAIERAEEFHKQTVRLSVAFDSLKNLIAIGIFPRISKLVEAVTRGVANFASWAKNTTLVTSAVGSLTTAIGFGLFKALQPYLGPGLKFVAIFLAVDDLIGFLEGKDSLIGKILNGWFGDGTATVVRDWINDAIEWFRSGFDDMRAVIPVFVAALEAGWDSAAEAFDDFVLGLEKKWNNLVNKLPDILGGGSDLNIDTGDAQARADKAKARTEAAQKNLEAAGNRMQQYGYNSTPTAVAPVVGPLAHPSSQPTNYVEINAPVQVSVPAGATAEATARAVARKQREVSRETHRAAVQALEQRGSE